MKTKLSFSCLLLLLCFATSCKTADRATSNQTVIRQAENTPDYFNPPEPLVLDNTSCKNPMIDARTGIQITLTSAKNGLGIYQVKEGDYGVKKGEALLLDCSTGKVKGIVKE